MDREDKKRERRHRREIPTDPDVINSFGGDIDKVEAAWKRVNKGRRAKRESTD